MEATMMQGRVLPGRKSGRKYPMEDIIIVAKAMLPNHAESQ